MQTKTEKLKQNLEQRIEELELLLNIDEDIRSTLDLNEVLESILEKGLKVVGCDRGDISLLDENSDELILACARGPLTHLIPKRRKVKGGITERAIRQKKRQWVADVTQDAAYRALLDKFPEDNDYGKFLRSFQSTVKVPLIVDDEVIGLFCTHSPEKSISSKHRVKLLDALIRRASWAVHNARVHEEIVDQLSELAAEGTNAFLSAVANPKQMRPALYTFSAEKALEITGARYANIRLPNDETGCLEFAETAGEGWTEKERRTSYPFDQEAICTWVFTTKQFYKVDDVKSDPPDPHYFTLFPSVRAHISVPLLSQGRVLGVLSVDSDKPYAFNDRHLRSLQLLARTVTDALGKIELLEREGLYSLGNALTEEKKFDCLCHRVLQETRKFLDTDAGSLFILDRQVGAYVLKATTGFEKEYEGRISYRPGEGLTGWVAKHKRMLRLRDCADERELKQVALDLSWKGKYNECSGRPERYLAAPLIIDQEVIGVIRFTSRPENREFTETDERRLATATDRIAMAIERLWLLQERESYIAELEVLSEIHQKGAQQLSDDEVLDLILDKGFGLIGCNSGHIRIREGDSDRLPLYRAKGYDDKNSPVEIRCFGEGVSGWVATHNETLTIQDIRKDKISRNIKPPPPDFVRSEVAVPLSIDGHVFGTLVAHKPVENGFTPHDIYLLGSMGAAAGSAIRTRRLFEVLNNIANIVTSISDTDELYDRIFHQIGGVIPTDAFFIALYDAKREALDYKYIIEAGRVHPKVIAPVAKTDQNLWRLIHEKAPQIVNLDPNNLAEERPPEHRVGDKTKASPSILLVPILHPGGTLMGVMSTQNYKAKSYTYEHLEMLSIISSQVGITIQGAQEIQETRQRLKCRMCIDRVAATAKNLDHLLKDILATTLNSINCTRGLIRLLNKETDSLILATSQGFGSEEIPLSRSLDKSVGGQVIRSGKSLLINCKQDRAAMAREHLEQTPFEKFHDSFNSQMSVPLQVGTQFIGVITAFHEDINRFQSEDLKLLEEGAAYASGPIQRALVEEFNRVYVEMTEKFQKIRAEAFPDENQALRKVLDYAMQLTQSTVGHISVRKGSLLQPIVHTASDSPVPYPDGGVSGRALRTLKVQLVTCLPEDPDFIELSRQFDEEKKRGFENLDQLLVVPIIVRDVPWGVICLHAPKQNLFTTLQMFLQMSLMEKLGQYTSTIIENAQRHRELTKTRTLAELGSLSGFVAHEINLPLDVIVKTTERLLKHADGEDTKQRLVNVMEGAQRAGNIVAQLLVHTRKLSDTKSECHVTAAVSGALRLVHHWLKHKNVEIDERGLDPHLPPAFISESELQQVIFNLVRNAAEAMPDGGKLIVWTRMTPDRGHIELSVQDTGVGMSEEIQKKIFQPSFTTKPVGQGTGLGLAVCQEIIQHHGGDIGVESELGVGSTFTVTIPITE